MRNCLNDKDIKNSIIYQSRNAKMKQTAFIGLCVIIVAALLIPIAFLGENVNYSLIEVCCAIVGVAIVASSVIILSNYLQNKDLLANFKELFSYEVYLNDFEGTKSTNKIGFIVQIDFQGNMRRVRTNYCQSGYTFSKYFADHLFERKVLGLYDDKKNIFYIISYADQTTKENNRISNDFSKEDIKTSFEYKDRMARLRLLLVCFIFAILALILVTTIAIIDNSADAKAFTYIFAILFLINLMAFIGVFKRVKYLINNYGKLDQYEVNLQYPRRSIMNPQQQSLFFRVILDKDDTTKIADTEIIFSRKIAKNGAQELIHKRVTGLFDEDKNRFYIIKIIGEVGSDDREYPEDFEDEEDIF